MKKFIFGIFVLSATVIGCNNKEDGKTSDNTKTSASSIKLPYEASYGTEFNSNVSDSNLLNVLNTYKYWESGDMKGLRSTMGDSIYVDAADGFKFKGLADSMTHTWQTYRDSLSSVKITMNVWLKNHSLKDSMDYINVWYKEIDTYKSGKVDSAKYEDDNGVKNGKLIWYSSHKQILK